MNQETKKELTEEHKQKLSKSFNPNIKLELINNKEWLYKKYWNEGLSLREIAEICNCSTSTVSNYLKKFNIRARNYSERNVGKRNPFYGKKHTKGTKQKISKLRIEKGLAKGENNPFYGKHFCGSNHPNWKGGVSFEPYCQKFNNGLKEKVRNEFNRVCFLCGKPEEENGKKLSVHHVDYNKGQGCGHSWTLVPLCLSCHTKTNYNRYFWFNLLQNYWLFQDEMTFYNINLFIPDKYPYKIVCGP